MLEKLAAVEAHYRELEEQLADPAVAADFNKVREVAQERSDLAELVERYREYQRLEAELRDTQALLADESQDELIEMAQEEVQQLEARMEELTEELRRLLLPTDPRDNRDVIVEIRAGTGGDEAGIFAADLYRMYTRYAENHNWKYELLDANETGVGGFKEVIFSIHGRGAYSRLKYEAGVHRVQRVPTTESQGRIHTSTATVAVLPEVDDVEVHINRADLRIDTFKSAGAGGQNVQKNETAIRITHLPTGIVVQCQDERSKTQNELRAMSILRAKLYEMEQAKQDEELTSARRSMVGSGERSEKIRTYNYPQNRVTDHRIGKDNYQLERFMNGELLDEFIDELATADQAERLQAAGI